MIEGWTENANGNWVLLDDYGVQATVYRTKTGWGAIWNGTEDGEARRLKGWFATEEDAMSAVDIAIEEGERSSRWSVPEADWRETKKGGGYYRKYEGAIISVKQARSGAWYAVSMGGALLGQGGRPIWFSIALDARKAVNALLRGDGGWAWVNRIERAA